MRPVIPSTIRRCIPCIVLGGERHGSVIRDLEESGHFLCCRPSMQELDSYRQATLRMSAEPLREVFPQQSFEHRRTGPTVTKNRQVLRLAGQCSRQLRFQCRLRRKDGIASCGQPAPWSTGRSHIDQPAELPLELAGRPGFEGPKPPPVRRMVCRFRFRAAPSRLLPSGAGSRSSKQAADPTRGASHPACKAARVRPDRAFEV